MDLISLALSLGQIAPSLLRYFGVGEQPVAIAEKVVEIAKTVAGKTDAGEAVAAIQSEPALAQQYQLAVLKADADLTAAYLADTQSARQRDVALHQAGYHNRRADLMVLFDVVGLIACLVVLALFRKDIPGEVVTLLSTIASLFGLCLRDAHQFEFGSSRGSREKDALLGGVNGGRGQ